MILRKFAAAVLPAVVAVVLGAGTVHADTGAPEQVRYETKLVGNTVETTLDGGFFRISDDGKTVAVTAEDGRALVTLPLSFRQDGLEYPMPHQIRNDARVLDLTVVKDAAAAHPAPVAPVKPVASNYENQSAMNAFATQFGLATAIGGFVGTAIGAVIGLVVGAAAGGVGAIPGFITGASVGAIIGTIVAGGPTLVVAGIDLINTLSAPAGTTKWYETTTN
ncbi:ammonium transporter [Nocardia vermiculata]|uniref:Ammonium transporter n=2 Tax=Nocardia vermiculata TaxID=257274 RepID=A0A846Y2E3_9NOCA|nr:ammonium transporter [Nocardia vermiculata]